MNRQLIEKIGKIDDTSLEGIAAKSRLPDIYKTGRKVRYIYADQIMCFTALAVMSFWRSGPRAVCLMITSIGVSIAVDYICCRMSRKEYTYRDLSNIAAGMCIALMMPASVSYFMVGAGAALAIGIKHIFGGKDNYIFNPTAVALAFFIICYPEKMLYYPAVGEWLPAFGETTATLTTGLESVLIKLGRVQELSLQDIMLGNFAGAMGTTHIAVILMCAVCLLIRHSISTLVTATSASVILIIAIIFPLYDNFSNTLAYEIVGGYMLFGLLFLANDPQTLPKTQLGRVYYGIVLGAATVIFRYYGKVEGSFVFALLAANTVSIRMDAVAEKTMDAIYMLSGFFRKYMSTYEKFRETAKTVGEVSLGDTQEIEISPTNYDMPAIDNKVTKINRKKPNLLKKTREKIGEIAEKSESSSVPVAQRGSGEKEESIIELKKLIKLSTSSLSQPKLRIKQLFKKKDKGAPSKDAAADNKIDEKTEATTKKTNKTKKGDRFVEVVDFEEVAEITKDIKSE